MLRFFYFFCLFLLAQSQGNPTYSIFPDLFVNDCDVKPTCVGLGLDPNSGSCADSAPIDYCANNCLGGYGGNSKCGGFLYGTTGECYYKTTFDVSQCPATSGPGNTLYRKDIVCDPGSFCSTSATLGYCPWISWNVPGCIPLSNTASATATATATATSSSTFTSSASMTASSFDSNTASSSTFSSPSALISSSASNSGNPTPSVGVSISSSPTPTPIPKAPAANSNSEQNLIVLGGSIGGGAALVILGGGLLAWYFCARVVKKATESSPLLDYAASDEVSFRSDT